MEQKRRGSSDIWDWPLQHNDGMVLVHNDKDRFEADLECPSFKPNEIDVKYMNNELVVHCFQQTAAGRTPREVHRTYILPPDVDPSTIKSTVKQDGVLQIVASKKPR